MQIDEDNAIAFLRHQNRLSVYCMTKWDWILDKNKWNAQLVRLGLPESDPSKRYGIVVLDETTVGGFIKQTSSFLVDPAVLQKELEVILATTNSWWDVEPLFPKLLIDFDLHKLTGCYGYDGNPRWEEYVPEGWVGEFADFLRPPNEYRIDEHLFYWIIEGRNVLDGLEV